jgi:hypothetical protein
MCSTPLQPQDLDMNLTTTFRELDHRRHDGIDVTMFWEETSNRVIVVVDDRKGGEAFEIVVKPGERPMDVFTHPFAYAATRRASEPPTLAETT